MCRITVSLLCIKVFISSHYATKRYRKLKLSFFTAFPHLLTPVSVLIYMTPIWFRNCSISAISARISNLIKVKTCTHMYLINCKCYFCSCMLNKNNYMFVMHILNRRGMRNFSSMVRGPTFRKNLAIELLSRQ